jgi:hypothetical protein
MQVDIGLITVDETVVVEVQLYVWVRVAINGRIQLAPNKSFPDITNIFERRRIVNFLARTPVIICGICRNE